MFTRRQSGGFVFAISMGLFSVGCFTNKNKDVAETAAAPPPSAYPDSSAGYPNNAAPGSAGATSPPSPSMASSTNTSSASSAPEPFQLREGEQLVPHVIVSGDSLSSIAGKYNSSIGRIQAANGMKDTKIFAGKTLQVPTSAAPANLAMNAAAPPAAAPAPSAGSPAIGVPGGGGYPPTMAPPTVPGAPAVPASVAGVPQIQVPANPSATSYPREGVIPPPVQPGGSYPVPSFEGSRIQFGN